MSDNPLNVLAIAGSPRRNSFTRIVVNRAAQKLRAEACAVDVLDLQTDALPPYNPDSSHDSPGFKALQARVVRADVIILGTPDYHGSISGTLKNFLDHFWHEFAGKLFVPIVASHEKGLTVIDQLGTVARQCYAWMLPYGISIAETDLKDGQITNDNFRQRLDMLVHDARVYGLLLARQRRADLAGTGPGFMARHRQ
jgi:FMN reductase